MPSARRSDAAERDLREIAFRIALEEQRPRVAERVIDELGEKSCHGTFFLASYEGRETMESGKGELSVFAALRRRTEMVHYTAFRINRQLRQRGKFWQQEPFDHLVRSVEQYEYLRRYIADNPIKEKLRPGEYYYRRYEAESSV